MAMTVGDIMTPLCESVSEDDSVLEAARKMILHRIPAIPVVDRDNVVKGMLTNRDVVELVVQKRDPATTRAAEVGSGDAPVRVDDPIEGLEGLLRDHRGGRVAVADAGGALVGVVGQRDVDAYRLVREELGPRTKDLVLEISPRDEFSRANRGAHLLAGLSALHCIRNAIGAAGVQAPRRILDFPCGYGRVLRLLKPAFPGATLAAGDIDRDGADFCAKAFEATPIYSNVDPGKVELPGSFDLIWCGSLLTHLDSDRWDGFLALMRDALAPGGLLVFTTHGPRDARTLRRFGMIEAQIPVMLASLTATGFAYADYAGQTNWGIALATPAWTRSRLAGVPGLRLVSYIEGGWDAPAPRQDVVACVKDGS